MNKEEFGENRNKILSSMGVNGNNNHRINIVFDGFEVIKKRYKFFLYSKNC